MITNMSKLRGRRQKGRAVDGVLLLDKPMPHSGTECGIGVRNYNDVKVGDQIECYERVEVARTLE